jgi:hypothetical protein
VLADRSAGTMAAVLAVLVGLAAAWHYAQLGLTLSHYDARGHLVVARRVIDSLTPGWRQIGALWLPLPHLLQILPVQIDFFYRTGLSGVAVSIAGAAVAAYAITSIIVDETGSRVAGWTGAALLLLNPNTLYLQSTPMSEPLLIALLLLSVLEVRRWVVRESGTTTARAGIVLFLVCWTRYEAWPFTAALLCLAVYAQARRDQTVGSALGRTAHLALYPAAAFVLFLVLSRVTVGQWFVSSGFFVVDNESYRRPVIAAWQIFGGSVTIAGRVLVWAGLIGAAAIAVVAVISRERATSAVLLAPYAIGLLPWYAFVQGHPFRVRYMVVQILALTLTSATAVGLLRGRKAAVGSIALVALVIGARPPFDSKAPMVLEAQWDIPDHHGREIVTAYLRTHFHDGPIMASMGSLGHYMQELSRAGFRIRDFLHEGNGDLWKAALATPQPYVRWIMIQEKAEGGDMLAKRAGEDATFLKGYARVVQGGGVALYELNTDRLEKKVTEQKKR